VVIKTRPAGWCRRLVSFPHFAVGFFEIARPYAGFSWPMPSNCAKLMTDLRQRS
jgi:hypothetical protein